MKQFSVEVMVGAIFFLATMLMILGIVALLSGCGDSWASENDNGWISVDGVTLQPVSVPCAVAGDESLVEHGLVGLPSLAAEWWNVELGVDVFDQQGTTSCAFLEVNYVPPSSPDEYESQGDVENTHLEF